VRGHIDPAELIEAVGLVVVTHHRFPGSEVG
jgi:hypothetical protein